MRYIIHFLLLLLLFAGCNKDNNRKQDPKPNWVLSSKVNKEFSMTYIVRVSVNGGVQPFSETDELAAFIGTECRGTATIVTNDSKKCFYLLIYSSQNDTEKLSFKYFSAIRSRIFEVVSNDSYFPNQTVGSLDVPFLIEFLE